MPTITTDRPLAEAVAMLDRKTPVGSAMSSREWELVPADVRMRAMFSARVEHERTLVEMQERLRARIALEKKDGRTMDRGVFIEEMRAELTKSGYKRGEDVRRGSLRDLKSTRRLKLIFDMNVSQAQGFARWKADMTPEGLANEPCYELIRLLGRVEVRDWPLIWSQAGGEFFDGAGSNDDYPQAPGRMIAAKTDPIWRLISRFGTPWPPFDWGSGMGLRGVDRDEAEALGVIGREDVLEPLETPFNETAQASLAGIPESGRQAIVADLAGDVMVDGDVLRIAPREVIPADEFRIPAVPADLAKVSRQARTRVAAMSETELEEAMQPIRNTVAYQRLAAAAREAGKPLEDRETVGRALLQFLAVRTGLAGIIAALRGEPVRDAWWSVMDFSGVAGFFTKLLGGAA